MSLLCVITFSRIASAMSAVVGLYVLSRSMAALQLIADAPGTESGSASRAFVRAFVDTLAYLLPDLDRFTESEWLIHGAGTLADLGFAAAQAACVHGAARGRGGVRSPPQGPVSAARSRERPVAAVPPAVRWMLAAALALQIGWHAWRPDPRAEAQPLGPVPAAPVLEVAALGDRAALARALMLGLLVHDRQPGASIPFMHLDYERVAGWLDAIIDLDPRADAPLLAARRGCTGRCPIPTGSAPCSRSSTGGSWKTRTDAGHGSRTRR